MAIAINMLLGNMSDKHSGNPYVYFLKNADIVANAAKAERRLSLAQDAVLGSCKQRHLNPATLGCSDV